MVRKIVQHGPSSLMVSLPHKWIKANHLKKGDELDYIEKRKSIEFFPLGQTREEKSITFDLTHLDRSSIMFYLRALYRQGYKEIRLTFEEPFVFHYRGKKTDRIASVVLEEVKRLVAIEITEHKENLIVLKQLAEPTPDELKTTTLRIFHMIGDMLHDLEIGVRKHDLILLQSLEEKHDSVTKLISFAIRICYQNHTAPHIAFFVHTLMVFDILIDLIKYYGRMLLKYKQKFPTNLSSYIAALHEFYNTYKKLFFSWDNKYARMLNKQREEIKDIYLNKPTVPYLYAYFAPFLEMIRDLIEARMCMPKDVFSF